MHAVRVLDNVEAREFCLNYLPTGPRTADIPAAAFSPDWKTTAILRDRWTGSRESIPTPLHLRAENASDG